MEKEGDDVFKREPTKREMQRDREMEEENVDRLSQLPDCLLHQILSLLPPLDAFRTILLSSSWYSHWASLPELSVSFDSQADEKTQFVLRALITKSLVHHLGNLDTITITNLFPLESDPQIDSWLSIPSALFSLKRLNLNFCPEIAWRGPYLCNLPRCILSGFPNLEEMSLSYCRFPSIGSFTEFNGRPLGFPSLKSLRLEFVRIDGDAEMNKLVLACPLIQKLEVCACNGFRRLELSSINLKQLCLRKMMIESMSLCSSPSTILQFDAYQNNFLHTCKIKPILRGLSAVQTLLIDESFLELLGRGDGVGGCQLVHLRHVDLSWQLKCDDKVLAGLVWLISSSQHFESLKIHMKGDAVSISCCLPDIQCWMRLALCHVAAAREVIIKGVVSSDWKAKLAGLFLKL